LAPLPEQADVRQRQFDGSVRPSRPLERGREREDRCMRRLARSMWLNPKLVVGVSTIEGHGLIARARIEAGEECCRLAGELMTDEEFERHIADREHYSALAIDEHLHLVQPDDDPTAKGNHSCDPNLWLADAVTIVARRSISEGDEATIDYALVTVDPAWRMPCNCGSALCRRVVAGDDWRLPVLRERYVGHWSPFIERRIALEVAGSATAARHLGD
jgi:hypothetical protein